MRGASTLRLLLVVVAALVSGCLAPAESMPAAVRDKVAAQLSGAGLNYLRAAASPDFISRMALSTPQAVDWVVDYNEAHGSYCGAGGCPLQIWVKASDGAWRLAFDQQVLGWRVDPKDPSTLVVKLHGALCGRSGIEECSYAFRWVGGASAYFAPVTLGEDRAPHPRALVQAIRLDADNAPTPARYAVKAYDAACMRAGGRPETSQSLQYLPDLNSDGVPEMLFDASIAWCWSSDGRSAVHPDCKAGACDSRLFSRGSGGWREVLTTPSLRYEIDYVAASRPVMKINGEALEWSGLAQTN